MDKPPQRPEGQLIARAMTRKGVNATQVAHKAGLSPSRWRHIVNGAQPLGGGAYTPVRAPADTLARMARAVDVTPAELRNAGRADAADILEDLLQAAPPAGVDEVVRELRDEQEQRIWDLPLPVGMRRDFIAIYRSRQASAAASRRQAG